MTFTKKITTAIATGAVLINALAPVALAESVTVTGNGALSNNAVNSTTNSTTTVNQSNAANIVNNVKSNASTGGNSSNFNTGGDSKIVTGNATTNVSVSTAANLNKASVANCGACSGGATNVTIKDNGASSENEANVSKNSSVFLNQGNAASIVNDIDAKANTGKNDNSFNTGGESVTKTGNATTNVEVANLANANFATIGGGNGSTGNSSVTIAGNGALSDNDVTLNRNSAVVLGQANSANIVNDIDAKAKTGNNDSTFNTGGKTIILTGDAKTDVTVDNAVNFNAAAVDCDCLLGGVDLKVAGNGADSENEVDSTGANALFDTQANGAALANDVDGNAKTGKNDVSFSTGAVDGDPLVWTGDSNSSTDVSNSGNVNLFDNGSTLHLPGNWDLGLNWDLSDLWAGLSHWAV